MQQNKWAANVEGTGERRDGSKVLLGKYEVKGSHLEDLNADGKLILNLY